MTKQIPEVANCGSAVVREVRQRLMDDGWKLGEQDLLDAIIYDLTEDNYVLESISLNGGVGVSAIKTDELGGRVGGVSIRCDDLLAGYCGVWKAVRDAEEPG